ncbi:MAG: hypothetical protein NC827_05865 [Candidatus Omnitrophica bacterium]|nr:hypothetical protein [Candidatus Omnitrophota bacterium]
MEKNPFYKRAKELIDDLNENELLPIFSTDIFCNDLYNECEKDHVTYYITKKDNEYFLIDGGTEHHVSISHPVAKILSKINKNDAIEMLAERISNIAKNFRFSETDVQNFNDERKILYECPKCQKLFALYILDEHECK